MKQKEIIKNLQNIFNSKIYFDKIDKEPYLSDWRKTFSGKAIAVVFPENSQEIINFVLFCKDNNLSIIPQGGNTGLCGAATPDNTNNNVIISLKKFNKIRKIDPISNSIILESGCILENVQNELEKLSKVFPIDLSSKGSCTIGGNVSTNAGGNNVIRYGSTRELVLGMEAILPNGKIINNLLKPFKDNTEYPFHKLLVGAEGTLGIITAVKIKIFEKPKSKITILVEFSNIERAIETLINLKSKLEGNIESFEILTDKILHIIYKHFPNFKKPFEKYPNILGIIDVVTNSDFDLENKLDNSSIFESRVYSAINDCMNNELINNAIIANSIKQQNEIWEIRENANLAQTLEGNVLRNDISLPIDKISNFWEKTKKDLIKKYDEIIICAFGHLGDGNIHYNLCSKIENDPYFCKKSDYFQNIVLENVNNFDGSFSAEHGIGQLKKNYFLKYKDKNIIQLMKIIKNAFDPKNIFNPGKIF